MIPDRMYVHFSPYRFTGRCVACALLLLALLPGSSAHGQDQPAPPVDSLYLPTLMRPDCPNTITLVLPEDGARLTNLIPTLNWSVTNATGADSVEILLYTNPERTGAPANYHVGPVTTRQLQFPENLAPGTTYYWIGRLVCGGVSGPDSKVRSFTTGSDGRMISPPSPLKPADNAYAPAPVTIGWSLIVPARGYRWYVRAVGSSTYESGVAGKLETVLDLDLKPGSRYEWWVRTIGTYAFGPESTHFYFTVTP